LQLKDELKAGGTTSGGESGGSPITVLHMQMEDEKQKSKGQEKIEIETQTEQPENEDKETGITKEELIEMAETESRETQVIICFVYVLKIYQIKVNFFMSQRSLMLIPHFIFPECN
jgi:hypothetical protein